jgi:hypothetical protein
MDKRMLIYTVMIGSVAVILSYHYLRFISPWDPLVIRLFAYAIIGTLLVIVARAGYTLVTTIRPGPLEDMVETIGLDLEEKAEGEEESSS